MHMSHAPTQVEEDEVDAGALSDEERDNEFRDTSAADTAANGRMCMGPSSTPVPSIHRSPKSFLNLCIRLYGCTACSCVLHRIWPWTTNKGNF